MPTTQVPFCVSVLPGDIFHREYHEHWEVKLPPVLSAFPVP